MVRSWPSFPTRERGLKLQGLCGKEVAFLSFPTRERGLKLFEKSDFFKEGGVVPYAGTWIETKRNVAADPLMNVVPYAGTWIETGSAGGIPGDSPSFPTRERGLKL